VRFFVTSGMRAHRVGMPTTGAGGRSVQAKVIAARYTASCVSLWENG
jgi:hypothetical protein